MVTLLGMIVAAFGLVGIAALVLFWALLKSIARGK